MSDPDSIQVCPRQSLLEGILNITGAHCPGQFPCQDIAPVIIESLA
jgi:hypothetical protein